MLSLGIMVRSAGYMVESQKVNLHYFEWLYRFPTRTTLLNRIQYTLYPVVQNTLFNTGVYFIEYN